MAQRMEQRNPFLELGWQDSAVLLLLKRLMCKPKKKQEWRNPFLELGWWDTAVLLTTAVHVQTKKTGKQGAEEKKGKEKKEEFT